MPVLGITGGVGTGKSTFTRALHRHLPAAVFDADESARDLLASDLPIRDAIHSAFGDKGCDPTGRPDRRKLRELVFSNDAHRRTLEGILHPAIRYRWTTLIAEYRGSRTWYYVDIPLLFETGAESHFNRIVVVACSQMTQKRRLLEHRGMDLAMSEKIIGAQLDIRTKITKANHVIWNDSTVACLEGQAALLAGCLQLTYV